MMQAYLVYNFVLYFFAAIGVLCSVLVLFALIYFFYEKEGDGVHEKQ